MEKDEDILSTGELREIYESDNAAGDCDCSFCREYRRRVKESKESQEIK